MPFVPRALFEVMTALVADLAAGKLSRVGVAETPQAATTVPAPSILRPEPDPQPLPPKVDAACRQYGRGPRAYPANAALARRLLAAQVEEADVVATIAQGL